MSGNRKGESGPLPYRTGRFFCVDSAWYFTTREGVDHGPFPLKARAEMACQHYIHICQQVEARFGREGLQARPLQKQGSGAE